MMTTAQQVFEREIKNESVSADDFLAILSDFKKGDQCILDFSKAKNFDISSEKLRDLLQQMIAKADGIVVFGSEDLEEMVSGMDSQKFHFIRKPAFSPSVDAGKNWKESIFSVSEDFLGHYFAVCKQTDDLLEPHSVAFIDIKDGDKVFQFGLVLNEPALHGAIKKVLLIPNDPDLGDCKDLTAEILNMMCAHIRTRLKLKKFDVTLGLPTCIPVGFQFPPDTGKYWIFKNENNKMGLFLKEVEHVCA